MDKKYHFIGIGGIGMSALARILLDKKISVSGSDLSASVNIDALIQKGAVVQKGHSAKHISPQHTVVFSSGIKESNPELRTARALNCSMLHRSELLADLMKEVRSFVCTGTHGKTTVSSLLTAVLLEGGLDPTFAIGGMVQGLNGRYGKGSCFVAEADESDGTFLNYHPEGAIITNVESEHMEHYQTIEALYTAFETFFGQVYNTELLFYCGDDPELTKLAKNRGMAYGFSGHCPLQLSNYRQEGWKSYFDFTFEGRYFADVTVALIGEHNALNAAAVFGMALRLGVAEEKIRHALASFPGIGRRCQKRGETGGVLLLDDYAHHPTEIEKTLKAVKQAVEERRLVVLFQPHRYTRTRDYLKEYGKAFEMADQVYVSDIYSAGEESIEGVTAERVVEEMRSASSVPCEKLNKVTLLPHDVFLTLGAGDVTRMHSKIDAPKKLNVGVVFGGLSCEHEISIRSARFVSASLDQKLYNVHYFGIDKQGNWITGAEAKKILENKTVVDSPLCRSIFDTIKDFEACDLFLPILHGTYGEDGTIQGLFEMLGKPYVGPDYRSAALSMDKVLTKRLVASYGVATPSDISFGHIRWQQDKTALLKKINRFPVYVKPVHLGSSVGISCVENKGQLEAAIEKAFHYDTQVMVEEGMIGCRELEFAVVGNSGGFRVIAPPPGEKLAEGAFVDYEKKYSENPVQTTLTPTLDPDLIKEGRALALKAYRAIGCSGMTRIDFLLDQEGKFWFFEMNPIPGLQQFSLFPKIWKRDGVLPEKLFDRLIILALQRKRQQDRHFRCLASC